MVSHANNIRLDGSHLTSSYIVDFLKVKSERYASAIIVISMNTSCFNMIRMVQIYLVFNPMVKVRLAKDTSESS
jgi:endonuclease V-like protein UPF0215 family